MIMKLMVPKVTARMIKNLPVGSRIIPDTRRTKYKNIGIELEHGTMWISPKVKQQKDVGKDAVKSKSKKTKSTVIDADHDHDYFIIMINKCLYISLYLYLQGKDVVKKRVQPARGCISPKVDTRTEDLNSDPIVKDGAMENLADNKVS